MIQFTCDQCGAAVRVSDDHAGQPGRCPKCDAALTIPATSTGAEAPPPHGAPPAPPGMPVPAPLPVAQGGKALAVCSLVFGILAIIPLLGLVFGLVALILGIVSLARQKPGTGMAVAGLVLGVVLAFLGSTIGSSLLLPSLGRARELARQATCKANLNTIGKAVALYRLGNDDRYPDDFQALIKAGSISEPCLRCPSSKGQRECDYVYLKPEPNAPDRAIMACDRKGNHRDYRSVLYISGAVRGMPERQFQQELDEEPNRAFAAHLSGVEGE